MSNHFFTNEEPATSTWLFKTLLALQILVTIPKEALSQYTKHRNLDLHHARVCTMDNHTQNADFSFLSTFWFRWAPYLENVPWGVVESIQICLQELEMLIFVYPHLALPDLKVLVDSTVPSRISSKDTRDAIQSQLDIYIRGILDSMLHLIPLVIEVYSGNPLGLAVFSQRDFGLANEVKLTKLVEHLEEARLLKKEAGTTSLEQNQYGVSQIFSDRRLHGEFGSFEKQRFGYPIKPVNIKKPKAQKIRSKRKSVADGWIQCQKIALQRLDKVVVLVAKLNASTQYPDKNTTQTFTSVPRFNPLSERNLMRCSDLTEDWFGSITNLQSIHWLVLADMKNMLTQLAYFTTLYRCLPTHDLVTIVQTLDGSQERSASVFDSRGVLLLAFDRHLSHILDDMRVAYCSIALMARARNQGYSLKRVQTELGLIPVTFEIERMQDEAAMDELLRCITFES